MNKETIGTDERQKAFESLSRAHEIMEGFHRQLSAFFYLVDEQLGGLSPNGNGLHVLPSSMGNMASQQHWFPGWFGRSYIFPDEALSVNPWEYVGPGATELAFVWIAAWDSREPRLKSPECWIGVADPRTTVKKCYTASSALWNSSLDRSVFDRPVGEWIHGTLNGKDIGTGATFEVLRMPMARLVTEDDVREMISTPLRDKYREEFGR